MGIGGRPAVQRSACRNRKLLAGGWPARMVGTPHRVEVPIQETCRVRRSPPSRPDHARGPRPGALGLSGSSSPGMRRS